MLGMVDDYYEFGLRNFPWSSRTGWLTRWRRGIRGIEYCALMEMAKEIARRSENDVHEEYLDSLAGFFRKAKKLLMAERRAMTLGPLAPYKCPDAEIQTMRVELFGENRRPGGAYALVMNQTEPLLLSVLREEG